MSDKLKGNQNVRDPEGRYADESLRDEPGYTLERDRTLRDIVKSRIGKCGDWESAAKVKAEVMKEVDACIMDAGLDPVMQTEGLTFSRAMELCKMGMAIQRPWPDGNDLRVVRMMPGQQFDGAKGEPPMWLFVGIPGLGAWELWMPSAIDLMAEDWRAL